MASINWNDVTAHASELSTVAAAAQTDILAYVNLRVAVAKSGGEESITTKLLRIYLAAHLGTIAKSGSSESAGPVILEMVGPVMKQYANASTSAALDSTSYGRAYKQLAKATVARGPMVV